VLNAIVGFIQEFRAERALQALQRLSAPHATVRRAGEERRIAEHELVPGDLVRLEAGDVAPADLRVLATRDLTVDEAALTGESQPVIKDPQARIPAEAPLGERPTMVYKGTHVTAGHGRCVAAATGAATEVGRIAGLMRARERPTTPLQRRLAGFGRRLSVAVLVICGAIFLAGLLRGEPTLLMALTAISLAVAAIPEALPAVVTISLALGAKRMAAQNALIRRLPAVETLGSVTIICCDKTGTLTQNAMRAERFAVDGDWVEELPNAQAADKVWRALGRAMALNNDAKAGADGTLRGDPTEAALLESAERAGFERATLERDWPRCAEIPFEAQRRRMTTLHRNADDAEAALALAEETARTGYRLLAFAERKLDSLPLKPGAEEIERDLTFLGLVALADPPRPEAAEALASCHSAGIEVAMITGDHPATAKAIASRLGMAGDDARVMTGAELQGLTEDERRAAVAETRIYARVSPEQKLDIVTALQQRNHFVAMTGDGVNDAPALKRADIGVAMGLKGTDVAREAADAVLLDDNFATIVAAVREGRRIYANICKFIKYTMTSNSGEIWTILLAPFLGLPLPLLPIQILWINLVTDGLPGLALGKRLRPRHVAAHALGRPLDRGPLPGRPGLGLPRRLGELAKRGLHRAHLLPAGQRLGDPLRTGVALHPGLAEQSLADRRGAADRGPAAGRGLPRAAAGGLQDQRPVGSCWSRSKSRSTCSGTAGSTARRTAVPRHPARNPNRPRRPAGTTMCHVRIA
jgi:Ca2+-transporting ATPase